MTVTILRTPRLRGNSKSPIDPEQFRNQVRRIIVDGGTRAHDVPRDSSAFGALCIQIVEAIHDACDAAGRHDPIERRWLTSMALVQSVEFADEDYADDVAFENSYMPNLLVLEAA